MNRVNIHILQVFTIAIRTHFLLLSALLIGFYAQAFRPQILNFTASDYLGHQANYDAVFDSSGVLYTANAYGLFEYDGVEWQKISLPLSKSPLALCFSKNNILYVGADQELGFVQRDSSGRNVYQSLKHLIPVEKIGRINFALAKDDKVYFVCYEKIYIYDGHKISEIAAGKDNFFLYCGMAGDELLVMESHKGLGKIEDGKIKWFKGQFDEGEIRGVKKISNKEYIIIQQQKVLRYIDDNFEEIEALSFLKDKDISDVTFSKDRIVISTQGSGVYILDQHLNLKEHFDKTSGLQNVFINAVAVNKKGDVCLATLNGISLLRINSSKWFIDESTGVYGMGYSSLLFRDTLYLGTSQGLFFMPSWSKNKFGKFQKAEGTRNFVYALHEQGGRVFCGDQSDVYEVSRGVAHRLTPIEWQGAWKFLKIPQQEHVFLVGTYHGIDVYRNNNGRWQYSNRIEGFSESSRQFDMDNTGKIWVSQGINGLYCLEIDKQFTRVLKKRDICQEQKVPKDYFNDIISINGQLKISSDGGIYYVDQDIHKDKSFQSLPKDPSTIRAIGNNLIYSIEKGRPILLKKIGNHYVVDTLHTLNNIELELIGSAEYIDDLGNNQYLAAIPDGFVLCLKPEANFCGQVQIRSVKSIGEDKSMEFHTAGELPLKLEFPYSYNSVRFVFASSPFEKIENVSWYYKIEKDGEAEEWQDAGKVNFKELSNLENGSYTFSVKALNHHFLLGSSTVHFTILPPWYRTTVAYLLYFVLSLGLIAAIILLVMKKFKESREELLLQKEEELKVQDEQFEQERLKMLLQEKETALAGLALNFAQKKEIITTLKVKMQEIIDTTASEGVAKKLQNLKSSIDMSSDDQENWENFQGHYNHQYNDLFEKIKVLDPNINESHLLLCSYIRMGKSNKEMSNLLSVSLSTIDKRKSRLRQKFNVPESQTFVEFIRNL